MLDWLSALTSLSSVARDGALMARDGTLAASSQSAFPAYAAPVTIGPAVHPRTAECTVLLFENVALAEYGQLATSEYVPPGSCPPPYDSVRLEWEGHVSGVQFDRYGALWLGGVELLRTTTPEPAGASARRATHWQIARDLTAYRALFSATHNTTLTIPNVVDETYTGVLYVTARIKLRSRALADAAVSARADDSPADAVFALADPTRGGGSPWQAMQVHRGTNVSGVLRVPARNVVRAMVDLYVSGHACEEFFYSNVPDELAPATGECGGGTYRELELHIDGIPAGVAYPFPTIYSGGVCPLLWRPLAGIHQLNLPPIEFDLAPFLGLLNDGAAHDLTARVHGSSADGVWYLDPVIRLWHARSPSERLSGRLVTVEREPPKLDVSVLNRSGALTVHTRGTSSLRVVGHVWPAVSPDSAPDVGTPPPAVTAYSLEAVLDADNVNELSGVAGTTRGRMTARYTRDADADAVVEDAAAMLRGAARRTAGVASAAGVPAGHARQRSTHEYPYYVYSREVEGNHSFLLEGHVRYAAHRREDWSSGDRGESGESGEPEWILEWKEQLEARAAYNRSTTPNRTVHVEASTSHATMEAPAACFSQAVSAANGSVTAARFVDGCVGSQQRRALCERFDECVAPRPHINVPDTATNLTSVVQEAEARTRVPVPPSARGESLLFRRPHSRRRTLRSAVP